MPCVSTAFAAQTPPFLAVLSDLLRLMRRVAKAEAVDVPLLASLREMDGELKELLSSWFDVGFLTLQTVNWDSAARLLERLMQMQRVRRLGRVQGSKASGRAAQHSPPHLECGELLRVQMQRVCECAGARGGERSIEGRWRLAAWCACSECVRAACMRVCVCVCVRVCVCVCVCVCG